ncbi:MAG: hypothetical protein HXL00_01715 [Candidatus Nanosynbacter sp.]|nr:hypothetical protein [Candidatus Nanosynbacter sp.]
MEHRSSSYPPEHSPDNERAAQLEKDRQYLLFLLANDLGYDTRDVSISSECSDAEASVNPAHYIITIPPRQECQQPGRTVAIYPDITLVFDTHATQQCHPEQHGSLESCTKEGLLDLIKQDPACGLELPHGQRFTASMVDALTHPIADARARITEAIETEQQHHIAQTRRSLGKVTIGWVAEKLKVAPRTIEKALDNPAISDKLGAITTIQRGTELQHLLTSHQVATLAEHLQSTPPPEGYRTLNGVAKKLGIGGNTVRRIIDELNSVGADVHGEEYHKATGLSYRYYSPTDQRKIEKQARGEGLFTPVPAGYLLRTTVAKQLHVTHATINHAIEALGITPERYRVRRQNGQLACTLGYHLSPEQAEQVAAYLGRSFDRAVAL